METVNQLHACEKNIKNFNILTCTSFSLDIYIFRLKECYIGTRSITLSPNGVDSKRVVLAFKF